MTNQIPPTGDAPNTDAHADSQPTTKTTFLGRVGMPKSRKAKLGVLALAVATLGAGSAMHAVAEGMEGADFDDVREARMEAIFQAAGATAINADQAVAAAEAQALGTVTGLRFGPSLEDRQAMRTARATGDFTGLEAATLSPTWMVQVTDTAGMIQWVAVDGSSGMVSQPDPFAANLMGARMGKGKGKGGMPPVDPATLATEIGQTTVSITDAMAVAETTAGNEFKPLGARAMLSGGVPGWMVVGLMPEEPGDDDLTRVMVAVNGNSGTATVMPMMGYGKHGGYGHGEYGKYRDKDRDDDDNDR